MFVDGRQIFDNAIVSFGSMRKLKKQGGGKLGFFSLKLNISKVYDKVEWYFLGAIMSRIGFSNSCIDKVMNCVNTAFFLDTDK